MAHQRIRSLPPKVQAATKKALRERLEAALDAEIAAEDAARVIVQTESARVAEGDA